MDQKAHQVVVVFLGGVREAAGCSSAHLSLSPHATLAEVETLLVQQFPQVAVWLPHLRFALDSQYASRSDRIGSATELALIPPVAGG